MTHESTRDLQKLAELMDSKYQGPFGFRFGWDGILGLIPGIGDLFTSGLSLYLIFRAALLKCPPVVLARMAMNLLIEDVVDMIPLLGNLFDFAWKANIKNLALLEAHLQNPSRTTRRSQWVVWTTFLAIVIVMLGTVIGTFYVLWRLIMGVAW